MINEVMKDAEGKMKKTIELFKTDLSTMKAGRASASLLHNMKVDYYGTPTPINQMANVSTPEPRLLLIQPWDPSTIKDIEKVIQASDLGITPANDGKVIRLAIPQLTEERRKELVKVLKKKGEECKVAIRNVRREANDDIKKLEKDSEITEDDSHKGLDKVQELTDGYIKNVDEIVKEKEKEIMSV